jgi:hypothetical protein
MNAPLLTDKRGSGTGRATRPAVALRGTSIRTLAPGLARKNKSRVSNPSTWASFTKFELGGDALTRLRYIVVGPEVDFFVLEAAPQPFHEDGVGKAAAAVHADRHRVPVVLLTNRDSAPDRTRIAFRPADSRAPKRDYISADARCRPSGARSTLPYHCGS